jgi:hypothetical protein
MLSDTGIQCVVLVSVPWLFQWWRLIVENSDHYENKYLVLHIKGFREWAGLVDIEKNSIP